MGILEVKGVGKRFGGLQALSDVNLSIAENSVHAIIGPNGAGKSTLVKTIYGLVKPDAGRMTLLGQPFQPAEPRAARAQRWRQHRARGQPRRSMGHRARLHPRWAWPYPHRAWPRRPPCVAPV